MNTKKVASYISFKPICSNQADQARLKKGKRKKEKKGKKRKKN